MGLGQAEVGDSTLGSAHQWWRMRCSILDGLSHAVINPPPSSESTNPDASIDVASDGVTDVSLRTLQARPGAVSAARRRQETNPFLTSCSQANVGNGGADGGDAAYASGPMVVAIVERVQSGIIGETLSAYGITGAPRQAKRPQSDNHKSLHHGQLRLVVPAPVLPVLPACTLTLLWCLGVSVSSDACTAKRT